MSLPVCHLAIVCPNLVQADLFGVRFVFTALIEGSYRQSPKMAVDHEENVGAVAVGRQLVSRGPRKRWQTFVREGHLSTVSH